MKAYLLLVTLVEQYHCVANLQDAWTGSTDAGTREMDFDRQSSDFCHPLEVDGCLFPLSSPFAFLLLSSVFLLLSCFVARLPRQEECRRFWLLSLP